jgi:hypothetical protein
VKNIKRRKTAMESLLDEDRVRVIRERDERGGTHEVRVETVPLYDGGSNPISMTTLKKIVSKAKNEVNNPDPLRWASRAFS